MKSHVSISISVTAKGKVRGKVQNKPGSPQCQGQEKLIIEHMPETIPNPDERYPRACGLGSGLVISLNLNQMGHRTLESGMWGLFMKHSWMARQGLHQSAQTRTFGAPNSLWILGNLQYSSSLGALSSVRFSFLGSQAELKWS